MAGSLAVKYRPKTFNEMIGQQSTIRILQQQLDTNTVSHAYLFCGASGCGKTTAARAFANAINKNSGTPIEIDAASNSGVDAVRDLIADAAQRSLDSEYKIFVIDECHSLSSQAWQAFLKCIEEPPEYTIFIFCTTNAEKVPPTIQNRVMRFNFTKVSNTFICQRLCHICEQENFINYQEACDYISKICNGGVRDAIALLEKCARYDVDLRIDNVLACLGNFSYASMFDFTAAIFNADIGKALSAVTEYYNSGNDLKVFIESYLDFMIDLTKYSIFKDIGMVKIPSTLQSRCDGFCMLPNVTNFAVNLTEEILAIKNAIKYDANSKTTVESMIIAVCRKQGERLNELSN